jgi:hypothetical protein
VLFAALKLLSVFPTTSSRGSSGLSSRSEAEEDEGPALESDDEGGVEGNGRGDGGDADLAGEDIAANRGDGVELKVAFR